MIGREAESFKKQTNWIQTRYQLGYQNQRNNNKDLRMCGDYHEATKKILVVEA